MADSVHYQTYHFGEHQYVTYLFEHLIMNFDQAINVSLIGYLAFEILWYGDESSCSKILVKTFDKVK